MVQFEIPDSWISNSLKIGGILIVLVMVATLVKPSITGNVVSRVNELNANLTECSANLRDAKAEVNSTNDALSVLSENLQDTTALYDECVEGLSETQNVLDNRTDELDVMKDNYSSLSMKFDNLEDELNTSSDDYDDLAEFAAKAACCPKRLLDDPNINSYNIKDNTVKCLADSEGSFTLEC